MGGLFSISDKQVTKTITKQKWIRGKSLIQGLVDDLDQNSKEKLS